MGNHRSFGKSKEEGGKPLLMIRKKLTRLGFDSAVSYSCLVREQEERIPYGHPLPHSRHSLRRCIRRHHSQHRLDRQVAANARTRSAGARP